jgi:hypothetical protein
VSAAAPIPQPDPFERLYTPAELGEKWRLDPSTIRRIFQDMPGVFKPLGHIERRGKRSYETLRIPESLALRVFRERIAK